MGPGPQYEARGEKYACKVMVKRRKKTGSLLLRLP